MRQGEANKDLGFRGREIKEKRGWEMEEGEREEGREREREGKHYSLGAGDPAGCLGLVWAGPAWVSAAPQAHWGRATPGYEAGGQGDRMARHVGVEVGVVGVAVTLAVTQSGCAPPPPPAISLSLPPAPPHTHTRIFSSESRRGQAVSVHFPTGSSLPPLMAPGGPLYGDQGKYAPGPPPPCLPDRKSVV